MNHFEAQVAELVRGYPHLYDPSRRDFKSNQVCISSWLDISKRLGVDDPRICKSTWRNLRDKFSKAKKRLILRRGQDVSSERTPGLYKELTWLNRFVLQKSCRKAKRSSEAEQQLSTYRRVKTERPKVSHCPHTSVKEVDESTEDFNNESGYLSHHSDTDTDCKDIITQTVSSVPDDSILVNVPHKQESVPSANIIRQLQREDDCDIFGKFVASELRLMEDMQMQKVARLRIQQVLLDVQLASDGSVIGHK